MPARKIEREAGRRYVKKAEEFLRSAREACGRSDWNAGASAAIHAGISAADAYLAWIHRVRSVSKDHRESVRLLAERGGADASDGANALQRLIRKKSMVEYDDRLFTAAEARDALARAERLVAWARDAIGER